MSAARAAVPAPDLHGGAVANALALPSLRGNAVLFTDTLLERLDEDEIVAICGHELAHFEYYDRARLRRISRATAAIAVAGATMTPPRACSVSTASGPTCCWFGALLAVMVFRVRDKQRQETVCDARAVELTGNPEPLVSGLTKCMRQHACRDESPRRRIVRPLIQACRGASGTSGAPPASSRGRWARL